jgi:hypothetical protein
MAHFPNQLALHLNRLPGLAEPFIEDFNDMIEPFYSGFQSTASIEHFNELFNRAL